MQKYFLAFLFLGILSPLHAMRKTESPEQLEKKEKLKNIKISLQENPNFDPNLKIEPNQTPIIFLAVECNDKELVDQLLDKRADINARNNYENTILHIATINKNDDDMLKHLLQKGAYPNFKNKIGSTPLLNALKDDNTDAMKLLVQYGADINFSNSSILGCAINSSPFIVSWDYNEHTFSPNNTTRKLPKKLEILQIVCSLGASLINTDYQGNNAFHQAISHDIKVATTLITNARFNFKNNIKTVLMILNRYNKSLYGNKDLLFLILSYLPEYFSHKGLYHQLSRKKYELQPFDFYRVNGHILCIQKTLQIKNQQGKVALEMLPPNSTQKKEFESLFNEKLPKDLAEFNKNYPNLESISKDNLARQIHESYNS